MKQFLTILIVILVAWASLFITVLNQSNKTNELIRTDQKLLNQDTAILNAERNTQVDLETKIADLQSHVDCLFNLATKPGFHIVNASSCTLATYPSAPQSTPVAKSPTPSNSAPQPKVSASSPQSTSSSNNAPRSAQTNLIQRLFKKLPL